MLQKAVIDNYRSNIRFKEICIRLLSRHFTWNAEEVKRFKDIIYFNDLLESKSQTAYWSESLFEKLQHKINWSILYRIEGIDFDLEFNHLYKFESDYGLGRNEKLYKLIFGEATREEVNQILESY